MCTCTLTVKQFDHKGSKLRWYSAPPLNIPRAKRAFETLEYAAFKKRRAAEGGARRITSALPVAASAANPISASNPVLVQRCAELMGGMQMREVPQVDNMCSFPYRICRAFAP